MKLNSDKMKMCLIILMNIFFNICEVKVQYGSELHKIF